MFPAPRLDKNLPGQIAPTDPASQARSKHESDALDEALVESFPASDPIAVSVTRIDIDG